MPTKKLDHREALLDAAQELILSKGFPATRVDEICQAASVTKGSFYHHFESKDALAAVLVERYFEVLTTTLCGGAWQEVEGGKARWNAFLDHAMKVVRGPILRRGCLLGSFALDLSETHPDIRASLEERFGRLEALLEPLIRAALGPGKACPGASARVLARQFVTTLQGSIVLAKAYGDHGKVPEAMKCYRAMSEALIGA